MRMPHRRLAWVLPLPILAGCAAPEAGDRAGGNPDCLDDWLDPCGDAPPAPCPAGEQCSDVTPYGLWFGGARFGDEVFTTIASPKVTAVGGTQEIGLYTSSDGGSLAAEFDVAVDGDAFTAIRAGGRVLITGVGPGSARLRILEPGTDLLYDRITLEVDALQGLAVRAPWFSDGGLGAIAFWTGRDQTPLIALRATGGRLADQSMSVAAPPPIYADAEQWDGLTVAAGSSAGDRTISVTAGGGQALDAVIRLVDAVDDVVWVSSDDDQPPSAGMLAEQQKMYCFRAVNQGAAIAGARLAVYASPQLEVVFQLLDCVSLWAPEPGTGNLTISYEGRSRNFTIPITAGAAPASSKPRTAQAPDPGPAGGDRAAIIGR